MGFHDLHIRPIEASDVALLEKWRKEYADANLEIPRGYYGKGVETAIAEVGGNVSASLTATHALVIDPFIHDPSLSGPDTFLSVYMMDRALGYRGQSGGAVVSYTTVPSHLTRYHAILRKSGYVQLPTSDCILFRRPLLPDPKL
jgi:hypothetical protein